ncbi:hypothetical protein EU537_11620 [Candidatus Thorarchaeota archaeon]|nr:MAG: hypothetical protein EU537_11620 [Candidatus Thorarchaeota archaeon]
MGDSNIDDSRDIMNQGVCRIQPSIPRANRHTHDTDADNNRPPGALSGIAVVMVLTGIPLLSTVEGSIGAAISGDLLLSLKYLFYFGTGVLMFASGWGLARLKKWALYGTILSLITFIVIVLEEGVFNPYPFSLKRVWAFIGTAMNLMMLIYLLSPDTRDRFE